MDRMHCLSLNERDLPVISCCIVYPGIMYAYITYRRLFFSPEPMLPPGGMAQVDLFCVDVPQNTNQSINQNTSSLPGPKRRSQLDT